MPMFQQLSVTGRTFVAGDLHGCLSLLEEILANVAFQPSQGDVCLLLGDLTDRGPDSFGCLQLLQKPGFFAIKGNHEVMLIQALQQQQQLAMYCWMKNGGDWFSKLTQEQQHLIRMEWLPELEALPYALEVHTAEGKILGLCHADIVFSRWSQLKERLTHSDEKKQKELLEKLVWSRERITVASKMPYLADQCDIVDLDYCLFGHTPIQPTPFQKGNCLWLDSGAVYPGGYLSVLEINEALTCHQARFSN